jgi:hypothetical protein
MRLLIARAALLLIAFGPGLARASVVFSNVTGSGDVGATVNGGGTPNAVAEAFTPGANYIMTDAQMLVEGNFGHALTFDVFLESNNAGAPGSVIEQIGFGSVAAALGYPGALETANSFATPVTLVSGTEYWLVLTPHQADSDISWVAMGSTSVPEWVSLDGGSTWSLPGTDSLQFQIDGTPAAAVPEPSTFAMFGGIGIALVYRIKRRHASTVIRK